MTSVSATNIAHVYKICGAADWRAAVETGSYAGSPDDRRDGYIHLSTSAQLPGTAAKYFAHQKDLVLVAFAAASLARELRWEPARGGALFPHVYGVLRTRDALWVMPLDLGEDGIPIIPERL